MDLPDTTRNGRCRRCGTWYSDEIYGNGYHTNITEQLCSLCFEGVRLHGWDHGYTLPELNKDTRHANTD